MVLGTTIWETLSISSYTPSAALLVGSYVGLLAVNAAAGSGKFGAKTNGEISAAYPTEVTPRGVTFAIWGCVLRPVVS